MSCNICELSSVLGFILVFQISSILNKRTTKELSKYSGNVLGLHWVYDLLKVVTIMVLTNYTVREDKLVPIFHSLWKLLTQLLIFTIQLGLLEAYFYLENRREKIRVTTQVGTLSNICLHTIKSTNIKYHTR